MALIPRLRAIKPLFFLYPSRTLGQVFLVGILTIAFCKRDPRNGTWWSAARIA